MDILVLALVCGVGTVVIVFAMVVISFASPG